MKFEIVGDIEQVETIAAGQGVKIRTLLRKVHGRGRWRKRKGRDRAVGERQAPPS